MKELVQLLGTKGFTEYGDQTDHTGLSGCAIQIVADAKFEALEAYAPSIVTGFGSNASSGSATTYPAGDIFWANIKRVKLHSGRVRVYERP